MVMRALRDSMLCGQDIPPHATTALQELRYPSKDLRWCFPRSSVSGIGIYLLEQVFKQDGFLQ